MADVGGVLTGAGGLFAGLSGLIVAVRARGKVAEATATTEEHRQQLEAWQGIAKATTAQLRAALRAHEKCESRVTELSDDVSRLRTELLARTRGWDRLPE